jgi:hypothetical protein
MEDAAMPLPPNVTQRDLVRMAVLLSPERVSATYRPAPKASS